MSGGLADLRTSFERLQTIADDCVQVTGRHLPDETATAEPAAAEKS